MQSNKMKGNKIKVATLTGALLDYWAGKVDGRAVYIHKNHCSVFASYQAAEAIPGGDYSPSTDWSQGGPIIEREDIWLSQENGLWAASCYPHVEVQEATTLLIAAMRCYVASKFGEEVDEV